ncbi:MFS transporter [Halochromatium glycolicum]|uniref:MFS transporter n=1 Tax=Halochromatium glycolicum TaxID=85075 RepID=A0AAJ0U6H7_9GAMM|nr:MFS transporter [Halochromatium glycolicum]MBK1706171.1 hypothetical protein [Halochromatium glycolicum]
MLIWPRYLGLNAAFGGLVGFRYTLDVWVYRQVAAGGASVMLLLGFSFAGMLLGEIIAARLSDRVSRSLAILASATAFGAWAVLAMLGVVLDAVALLWAAGALFGVGLGLHHASVDAWLDSAMERHRGQGATDLELSTGFLLYNSGYLGAATLAFPLLFGLNWSASLESASAPQLVTAPYFLCLVLTGVVFLLRPAPDGERDVHSARPLSGLALPLREYWAVLAFGRFRLVAAILVGACINLLVQFMDHFAPATLLPGREVGERALSIFSFNLTVVLVMLGLTALLARLWPRQRLSDRARALLLGGFIATALGLMASAIVLGQTPVRASDAVAAPILLGFAQSLLLALLPLTKSWVLEFGVSGLRATALSLLGVSKRLLAIGATLMLGLAGNAAASDPGTSSWLLWVLLCLGGGCIGVLILNATSSARS